MSRVCPFTPRKLTDDRSGMMRLASPPPADAGGAAACASSGVANGVASAPSTPRGTGKSRLRRVVTNEGIITRSPEELTSRISIFDGTAEGASRPHLTLVRQHWVANFPPGARGNRWEFRSGRAPGPETHPAASTETTEST